MIGPMVIACVAIPEDVAGLLAEIGVRDSKKLSAKRRVALATAIRALPGVRIEEEIATPPEIDAAVRDRSMTLNGLEITRMARLADRVRPDHVFVDLLGTSPDRFQISLLRLLDFPVRVTTSAHAEDRFPVTAAASIIAKTRRDALVAEIDALYGSRFGPVGSGYPSDPKTAAFLRAASGALNSSGIIRQSWNSCTLSNHE